MASIPSSRFLPASDAARAAGPSRRHVLHLAAFAALAAVAGPAAHAAEADDAIAWDTARAEHAAGRAVLIDLREPQEHAGGVVQGARLLPSSQFAQRWKEIPADASRPVYLVCATQNRSRAVLKALREQAGSYPHVRYVSGGMTEWARRGWPTVKP